MGSFKGLVTMSRCKLKWRNIIVGRGLSFQEQFEVLKSDHYQGSYRHFVKLSFCQERS